MDPVSITLAVVPIASELIRLGCGVQKLIKKVKNARPEVEKLANETILFVGLYKRFMRACNDDTDAFTKDQSAMRPLILWAERTANELEKLLDQVKALYPQSKIRWGFEDDAIARVVWINKQSQVKALRASLSVARESIHGFTNLMCLKKVNDQIGLMMAALRNPNKRHVLERKLGTTLERKIEELQVEVTECRVVHRVSNKTLEAAKEKLVTFQLKSKTAKAVATVEELFEFTEILDDYAREVIPPRQSGRRADSFASHSTSSIHTTVNEQRSQATASVPPVQEVPRQNEDTVYVFRRSPILRVPRAPSNTEPVGTSSSASDKSSGPEVSMSDPKPSPDTAAVPGGADVVAGRPEMRAREYINDPNGNILSPPIVRRDTDTSRTESRCVLAVLKTETIGRHTLRLDPTGFFLNNNHLNIASPREYEIADTFFSDLITYRHSLDHLDHLLRTRHMQRAGWSWDGIPGWVVTATAVKMLPMSIGEYTLREAGEFGTQ
ncbi:hypothetical protein EJ07DRAFT_151065 [Lizonia empirigonia]|nr:hypothetical protein EJ07DRAFT_151065 [Lizonia empirigonia]